MFAYIEETPIHELYIYGVIFRADFISVIGFGISSRNLRLRRRFRRNSAVFRPENERVTKNRHRYDSRTKFCVDFEKNDVFDARTTIYRIILHVMCRNDNSDWKTKYSQKTTTYMILCLNFA